MHFEKHTNILRRVLIVSRFINNIISLFDYIGVKKTIFSPLIRPHTHVSGKVLPPSMTIWLPVR